jgi:hypothetical protein
MFLVVVFLANHGCIGIIGGQNGDYGRSIIFDEVNQNFIIVGSTASFDAYNSGFIASYSTSSLPINLSSPNWFKLIDIENTVGNDQADCVVLDGTDYYVLCGFVTKLNSSKQDLLLAKFNINGIPVFAKAYDVDGDENGAGDMKNDRAAKMIVDSDGNYVIVGTTHCKDDQGDILVAKFEPDGDFLYAGIIGYPNVYDVGMSIIQDGFGDYVLVGYSTISQDKDIVIIKLTDVPPPGLDPGFYKKKSVRLEWPNGEDDIPRAIVYHQFTSPPATIHSYVVAGHTKNPPPPTPPFFLGNMDLLIFKINTDLNTLMWGIPGVGRYFNTPTKSDGASSLIIADDNNLVVGGFSRGLFLFSDGLMAKFNQGNGNLMWARTTENIYRSYISDIDKIPNPGSTEQFYIATGSTYSSSFGNADIMATLFHKASFNCYSEYIPEVPGMSATIIDYCDLERCKLSPYNVAVTPEAIHGKRICPQ